MLKTLAPLLIAASAGIIVVLGLLHLVYTFYGPKFLPRDRDLKTRMQEVSPVITRETTVWKAWVGFNASHSYGAILFGAVYGYLSLNAGRHQGAAAVGKAEHPDASHCLKLGRTEGAVRSKAGSEGLSLRPTNQSPYTRRQK